MQRALLDTGAAVNTIHMSVLPVKAENNAVITELFAADGFRILRGDQNTSGYGVR